MSGWEWLIVLGLWAWLRADLYLLRRDIDEGFHVIDSRRIEAIRRLKLDLADKPRNRV